MPRLLIVAGPNGCGKSTFASKAAGTAVLHGLTTLNPDDYTKQVTSEFVGIDPVSANLVGAERSEKAVWRAVAEGGDAAIETVLSSEKFFPIVRTARARGYSVHLIYVALQSVETAVRRVQARIAQGGHGVPANKIRSRWSKSFDNLIRMLELADEIIVFSNEGVEPTVVAERRILTAPLVILVPNLLPDLDARTHRT